MKILNEELKEYFSRMQDIRFALLFGSYALGTNNPLSDLDVAVYFEEKGDLLALGERQIDVTGDLMRICGISNVDVIILNVAIPFLAFQVIKNGRLIYARDERAFYRFKASVFMRYQDIRPMYDLYDTLAQAELKKGAS